MAGADVVVDAYFLCQACSAIKEKRTSACVRSQANGTKMKLDLRLLIDRIIDGVCVDRLIGFMELPVD